MDNNELDKLLKEKLQGKIEPTAEFEKRVSEKIIEERDKTLKEKYDQVKNEQLKQEKEPKRKKSKAFKITSILSMAAMFIIVFTLGLNLKTSEITSGTANLISIKAITPTSLESGVLANNSEFIIEAEGENLNVDEIRKSIYVEPALDYTIEKTINKNEYKLTFNQNIPDNTIVKLQYVKNKITEDSWAYQTSNKLSVTSTYPSSESTSVEATSVIEIDFSYASIQNLEQYVTFSPAIDGKWEHLGKIWRFTPSKKLENNKTYTVVVSKNLTAEGQTLGENYLFKFTVGDIANVFQKTISLDSIVTAKPNEQVKIEYYNWEKIEFGKVAIGKFASKEDFINYLQTKVAQNVTKQGDYEVTNDETYITLKQSLKKGYYIAKVKDVKGNELFEAPIQISEISAYAMETEKDILVWTAKGNELASNIEVEYEGKKQTTNSDGIATLTGVLDGTKTVKYVTVGGELVIGVYNYGTDNYPSAYLYTDRPLYKNTDTINVWGFVPRDFFFEKIEDDFYIELNEEGKKKIEVQKDGTFEYKYELKNHIDHQDSCISLYYKDKEIATRYINISNYELQNYTYEVIAKKDYGYTGENFDFDVKVTHITGLSVPNKKVLIIYNNQEKVGVTGADGIAHFTVKLEKNYDEENEYLSDIRYDEISIYNGDQSEYNNIDCGYHILRLNRDVYLERDYESNDYNFKLYKLYKNENIIADYDGKKLYNGIYETDIDINLIETERTRRIDYYDYNEYTKQNEPVYTWDETNKNTTKLKTIKSTNGVISVKENEISMKKNTEDKNYEYILQLVYKDVSGKEVRDDVYVYDRFDSDFGRIGYWNNSNQTIWEEPFYIIDNERYFVYRYLLKTDTESLKIGDTVTLRLAEASEKGTNEIKNAGKLLTVNFKEQITKSNVITENEVKYTFTQNDFPGSKIASAYFVNGKFYRMPTQYFDFDEKEKKIDVEITTDKAEYGPRDEVSVTIKTTNKGTPVRAAVNMSVVNEAIFEVEEDSTEILNTIYKDLSIPSYEFSTYVDTLKFVEGGEGGGGEGVRAEFGDTAAFKTLYTGADGTATFKFKLPDNITTYRITAHAANDNLQVGVNTKKITSKTNFFIQTVEPRGLKTSDDVVLNATTIAEQKYDVEYEFTIKELNKTLAAKGTTNAITTANFGNLPFGTYTAVIKGTHGTDKDVIQYTFNVVESTQEVKNKTTINVNETAVIKPSKNPIVLEIYRKNMAKNVKYVDFIESTITERLDTQIAYNKVQNIKEKYYGEKYQINNINMYLYDDGYLKNLKNGPKDLVLTALTIHYAKEYTVTGYLPELGKDDNLFEYYLIQAAKKEPVLKDLLYLKDEKNITNYNKLMVTLGLEFLGDYQNAKTLYSSMVLTAEEAEEYKSIIAIIETFIAKDMATAKIDQIIESKPSDEYVRFAILSYFENSSTDIENTENVKVISGSEQKDINLNGMQVQKIVLNNEQLSNITFETTASDIMVSYYYQTSLENITDNNVKNDIKISIDKDLKIGNEATLQLTFNNDYEGEVRIALPNSLRLAQKYKEIEMDAKYYILRNNIDYVTVYKTKDCKSIKLPLLVIYDGKYKFENVVCDENGTYHISNSLNLEI